MGSKKIIQLLIVLGVLLGLFLLQMYSDLIWENKPEKEESGEVISIWTMHGDTEKALNVALEQYKEKHPEVTFEVTIYKNEVYQTAVNNAILTDSLPDMFFMWGHSKLWRFVNAGMIQEITEAVEEEGISPKLREGGLDAFTYNGEIYALPLYGWRAYLFCNRDLFEENGIKYPESFEEFLEVSEKFKQLGITPAVTGAKDGWLSSLYYMSLVQGEGKGDFVYKAATDKRLFSSFQFAEAAKKMDQIIKGDIWQKGFLDYDGYNAVHLFSQGEAAMLYYGNWASTFLESDISKVKGKVDVIPFPNKEDDEGIGGYVDTFVINKHGVIPQSEEMIHMYIEIMNSISNVVVNDIGAGIPVYKSQAVDEEKFPILYQCWTMYNNQTLYPAYDQIMSEELSGNYYYLLSDFVYGKKSYKEFIEELSEE
ncbi:raffinose/stachyose/melibiose transport system substrate-binding protein [Kineothrix alysoides]|uniref:Raffinose/stachyose/melibiose transport system substrate-binding protein n=2 Tax=Kineothrix alysoides TaxID=1469948 RepID=A0A4R1QXL3_9FIRM|nr:raffinose/stachyose/melibiose transport system substrate-binding protein [Kineothrix alysoides]